MKLQTDTIHAMPLIRRRRIPLPLENMSQVTSTVRTHNLRPLHAKSAIRMASHRPRDRIEVGGPSASGFKLVVRFVEGGVAAGAGVDAFRGTVLVVFAREGRFGAFFAEDAELFCCAECQLLLVSVWLRNGPPLFRTVLHSSFDR